MRSTPELLVDRLELRGRPLEVAVLVLAPTSSKTPQPIGAHTPGAKPLAQQVDHRLVERLAPTTLFALQSLCDARRQIPDRQSFDLSSPLQSINAFIR